MAISDPRNAARVTDTEQPTSHAAMAMAFADLWCRAHPSTDPAATGDQYRISDPAGAPPRLATEGRRG